MGIQKNDQLEVITDQKINELIVDARKTSLEVFTDKEKIDVVIDKIKEFGLSFTLPSDTAEDLKAIRKYGANFNKVILKLDNIGKKLVEDSKKQNAIIDGTRRYAKERLREVYEEIMKPVIEADEAKRKKEKEEAEKAEQERLRLIRENEGLKAKQREKELMEEGIRKGAELAKLEEAQNVAKAKAMAEKAKEREAKARAEAEAIKKQLSNAVIIKNTEDKNKISQKKNEAYHSLLENGIEREIAIKVITLIAEGKINNVLINYA